MRVRFLNPVAVCSVFLLSASTLESEEVALLLEYVLGDGLPVQAVKMHRTIPMESVLMNTSFIRNQPILSLRYALVGLLVQRQILP